MSASGPDLEKQATKIDYDTTQTGEDDTPAGGFSHYASLKQSGPSNPHPPFYPSNAGVKEQMGEKPWRCGDPRHYDIPKDDDGWQKCKEMVEKYDNEMCNIWKDEVDNLLVFAGLFSGVVTAFAIQSYQWLHEHSADSSARLLSFIATQLANSTNPLPPSIAIPEFTVTQAQIRINIVWFLSLTVSLTTVLVGVLCLQWLREFQRDATVHRKDAVAIRQIRYEGLKKWHVRGILSILPLLLQLSLVLFFIGLLDLLWSLNTPVAACVSAVVGMVMLFLIATTTLPALQHALTRDKYFQVPQCPYKSPQSWLFYCFVRWFLNFLFGCYFRLTHPVYEWENLDLVPVDPFKFADSWREYDLHWRLRRDAKYLSQWDKNMTIRDSDAVHSLHWINKTLFVESIFPVYHSLAELDIPDAAATISGLIDSNTFKTLMQMDDQSSWNEMQQRDILAAIYLRWYKYKNPVLQIWYAERAIRVLNMENVPQLCYGWLSEILQDLASNPLLAPSVTTGAATQLNTNKIMFQALLCVKKSLITRNVLFTEDVVRVWILLRQLLTLHPSPPPNLRHSMHPIGSELLNLDHINLAGELFDALEAWLRWEKEMYRWESIKVCAEGMIRLFSSSIDITALNAVMAKATGLTRALHAHMLTLGGAAAVLERKIYRWGFDVPVEENTCEVGQWDSLVSRFEGIEAGEG